MLNCREMHLLLNDIGLLLPQGKNEPSYAYEHCISSDNYVYIKKPKNERLTTTTPLVIHPENIRFKDIIDLIDGVETGWKEIKSTSFRRFPRFNGDKSQYGYGVSVASDKALYKLIELIGGQEIGGVAMMNSDNKTTQSRVSKQPVNQILYGPPGTGKTYQTISKAVEILDPEFYDLNSDGREMLKGRYDELSSSERVGFVTFHQSFSYEDFVEGLKAQTNEVGAITYDVEDGVFKSICSLARSSVAKGISKTIDFTQARVWKMSLGNTLKDDGSIFDECIDNDYLLLGYGKDINFSSADTKSEVLELFKSSEHNESFSKFGVDAVNVFKNKVRQGDIVVISDGNKKFRAIAQVTGDYRFFESDDRDNYFQCRDVEWLKVFDSSRPIEELFMKSLSQMTIYELKPKTIKLDVLSAMLSEEESSSEQSVQHPYVLIIDEINRGNIAKIFGELITLIEPSKRLGSSEALSVRLPYSKGEFSVPSNLYIIGTMNTADRSLAQIDIALRRRFSFEELMPDIGLLSKFPTVEGVDLGLMLEAINTRIELLYDREHTIGHSHFMPLNDEPTITLLAEIFESQVLPLLEEYFFEDWDLIGQVLGDNLKPSAIRFIQPKFTSKKISALMGAEWEAQNSIQAYKRNTAALIEPKAYIGIYDSSAITELGA